MSTAVQFRRGTTAQHSSFTGAVGEITVDTDKDVAVVHDGSLAGGYPLAGANIAQTFTKAQRGALVALTSGATVTADFAAANNFSLILAHNVTLANPTNLTAGQSGSIIITQAASGGPYTVAYGSAWKFAGGTAPTKTITASSVCVITYLVESGSRITANMLNDVK
jgi:hypothetical protein